MATGANTTPLGVNPILAARQAADNIPALKNRQQSLLAQGQAQALAAQQQQLPQHLQPMQQQPAQKQSNLDNSSRQSLTAHIEAAKRAAEGEKFFEIFITILAPDGGKSHSFPL